jgi:hypothetical protein
VSLFFTQASGKILFKALFTRTYKKRIRFLHPSDFFWPMLWKKSDGQIGIFLSFHPSGDTKAERYRHSGPAALGRALSRYGAHKKKLDGCKKRIRFFCMFV